MELVESGSGIITIPAGTTVVNVVAGTDADPFTVLELSCAVAGTGMIRVRRLIMDTS